MRDKYNLERFIQAQSTAYQKALNEIINGKKLSHWMWYIFPQIKGLGRSETSKFYAIRSKEEALAYFNHPLLGKRLIKITEQFYKNEKSAFEILGSPDVYKMKSSMTLFHFVQDETDIFIDVIDKFYDKKSCKRTFNFIKFKNSKGDKF